VADVLDPRVLADLRESVGGDQAFLAELIDELIDDAPRQLEALRVAVAGGEAEVARRAAHTLKGNGRTFGAAAFSDLCLDAETAATRGDLDAVAAELDAIGAAWEQVRVALLAARDGAG
jgi:HPt (histidine-containing phosphotransfer) domain-containing protein